MAEQLKVISPSDLPGIEVWSVKNSARKYKVFHETYTVCSIRKAHGEWNYRGASHTAAPLDMMLMEPGELHVSTRLAGLADFSVLHVRPSLMKAVASENGYSGQVHLKFASVSTPALFRSFQNLHHALEGDSDPLKRESLLVGSLSGLLKHCAEKSFSDSASPSHGGLHAAREYIQENWEKNLTLRELAGVANLSRFHFLRSFSRFFGLPPHAYQTQIRISKARALLAKGTAMAGMKLGFSDVSHMIRHFKRSLGLTPGQYAAMVRKPFSGISC